MNLEITVRETEPKHHDDWDRLATVSLTLHESVFFTLLRDNPGMIIDGLRNAFAKLADEKK